MKTTILLGLLIGCLPAAARAQVPVKMLVETDLTILHAEEFGATQVLINFSGLANPDLMMELADELRSRGYTLDEETELLNPCVIKVLRLEDTREVKGGK